MLTQTPPCDVSILGKFSLAAQFQNIFHRREAGCPGSLTAIKSTILPGIIGAGSPPESPAPPPSPTHPPTPRTEAGGSHNLPAVLGAQGVRWRMLVIVALVPQHRASIRSNSGSHTLPRRWSVRLAIRATLRLLQFRQDMSAGLAPPLAVRCDW